MNATMLILDQLISATEAAQIIGVSPERVLDYIGEKRLPAAKVGRQWVLLRHNAESFKRGRPGRGSEPGHVE